MKYYQTLVTSSSYYGKEALTYSSPNALALGSIVLVPLRATQSSAIIIKEVTKPSFASKEVIRLLVEAPIPRASLQLLAWMQNFYPSASSVAASLFVPSSLMPSKLNKFDKSESEKPKEAVKLPQLSDEQVNVLTKIRKSDAQTYLLHGDTGSGKTRVYAELAHEVITGGSNVIILTPEIGLTPQMVLNLQQTIQATIVIIHSNLTLKERRNIWLRIISSKNPLVIVGPRSALFAPIPNVKLIVVDEFHDQAYKQEQSPYYSSIRVASALANIHGAKLILGSATPTITEYYIATEKHIPILRMEGLASGKSTKTHIEVVNARDKKSYTRNSFLSDSLLKAIEHAQQNKKQSLVFLNRRGTARLVLCQDCDWHAVCPSCDLPLTYHGDTHTMRCHTCGYKQTSVVSCPKCGSSEIIFRSIGTKSITEQLTRLFPDARIQRFDSDNSKLDRFDQNYQAVANGDVDIIVGTQMLVKGLDLPNLAVVGVVAADSSLYFPDYTAEEQTYQILTQVVGRVGRGHTDGTVIVQTYAPDGTAQIAALQKDWSLFYNQQILERQQYVYPPFCYLLKLTCARKTQKSAIQASDILLKRLRSMAIHAQIIGPTPRFNEKASGNFNWQVIIKSKQRSELLSIISNLPSGWSYDIDPSNLL
ncbi:MAG: primosomal protein N' [Candidatus Saccharibacteria bacterium]|nr:primosomal protein N' [Candidatus Saccharibacteria bacterium]